MQYDEIIVIGSRSFTGQQLVAQLQNTGARLRAVSSADVNFLDEAAVQRFFGQLDSSSRAILFPQVINKTQSNSYESFKDNLAIVNNLRNGLQRARVDYLVYFSSVDVYGNRPDVPITENSLIAPDTWYGLAKFCCESLLLNQGDLVCPTAVLRVPGMYGPYPGDKSVIGKMVSGARDLQKVSISGAGNSKRDYLFVDDVVGVIRELIHLRYTGVLNLASGCAQSVRNVAERICEITAEVTGARPKIETVESDPAREFDLVFDGARLKSVLPNFHFTPLDEGIRRYFKVRA